MQVARLRVADRHRVRHVSGDRVGHAAAVARGVTEERHDVARRGKSDAEHQRILRRVDELVQPRRIEPVPQTERAGSGVPGNGTVRQSANAQSDLGSGSLRSSRRRVSAVVHRQAWRPARSAPPADRPAARRPSSSGGSRPLSSPAGTLWKRARTGPVTGEPSACLATGTAMVWLRAVGHDVALPAADERDVTVAFGAAPAVAAVDDL